MNLYSLFNLLFVVLFFSVSVHGGISMYPCLQSTNHVDSSIASWRKDSTNDMLSEIEYHICGKTFNVYSFVTQAKVSVDMHGTTLYSHQESIREPSNQDIDSTTYCFHGIMKMNIPFVQWPYGSVVQMSFSESGKEPLLTLCSN